MFKELKGLGVVVQKLSKELSKVVRRKVSACRYINIFKLCSGHAVYYIIKPQCLFGFPDR